MPRSLRTLLPLLTAALSLHAEPLPPALRGSWRIDHILPTTNQTCWSTDRAATLLGSTLIYRPDRMTWQGGTVPLNGTVTRLITSADLADDLHGDPHPPDFIQLGIHSPSVLEVDLQHEDADITGATTEVPGDSVLLAAPNRIIVSACGVYFQAHRTSPAHP